MKLLILIALALLATACSSKKVMKNCEALGQGFWQCEKP